MSVSAQHKTLTFQDLIPGGKNSYRFTPQYIWQLQWCDDHYIYSKSDSLLAALPTDRTEKVVFTLGQLNEKLLEVNLPASVSLPGFFVPDRKLPVLAFQYKNNRVHYNIKKGEIVAKYALDSDGSRWEYDATDGNIAYTKENNVFIITPDGITYTVTNETNKGIVCGTSVHQNEFGINKGLFWSPKGGALAFYRMDETMVSDYPVVNIRERIAKVEPFKYPMAGMKSHEVTVGVYNMNDRQTVWLKTGLPKEKYLTNIAWSPDGKSIYIAELNRGQDTCRLVRYNAITGERENELFVETNERYVEPQEPVLFLPENPLHFIWQSRRDGYNHLYLYNTDGKMIKQLTKGSWLVKEVCGFDTNGRNLFFMATAPRDVNSLDEGSPLEVYLWKLDMKTGKRKCMNTKTGVHGVSIDISGSYMIDQVSSPEIGRAHV